MALLHEYEVIDLSYFGTAPIRLDDHVSVQRPVSEIWPIFESNRAWHAFDPGIVKARWTSDPPIREGSTRHVDLSRWIGGGVVNEVFFDWQPQQSFAFYMKDGTSDLVHAYGELWSFKDLGGQDTEIRLQTAFQLNGSLSNRLARWFRFALNWGYGRTLKSVKSYILNH